MLLNRGPDRRITEHFRKNNRRHHNGFGAETSIEKVNVPARLSAKVSDPGTGVGAKHISPGANV
jgi:hypothetical protein